MVKRKERGICDDGKPDLQLGLACIVQELSDIGFCTSRTMRLATICEKDGVERAKLKSISNVRDLCTYLYYCKEKGIHAFRITSNLVPHATNPRAPKYDLEFLKEDLKQAGKLARLFDIKTSFHPGQFSTIGAKDETILANAFADLEYHADIFKMMGYKPNTQIQTLHGGGIYGDWKSAQERWIGNFKKLRPDVQKMIKLENTEFNWSVMECLDTAEKVGIGFILDIFHNEVSDDRVELTPELLRRIAATWGDQPMKIHLSEQSPGERRGTHSKSLSGLPDIVLKLPDIVGKRVYCYLETRDKEKTLEKMHERYFEKRTIDGLLYWVRKV